MGGEGTFAGTSYQAKVIAYIYVHLLTQSRLGWLPLNNDVPVGVLGETDDAGDDIRVELGGQTESFEVQVKHGLTAGNKLLDAIEAMQSRRKGGAPPEVVMVVDGTSSKPIRVDFATDLKRLRFNRADPLKPVTQDLIKKLPEAGSLLRKLTVVTVNVDHEHQLETKLALLLLRSALEDEDQILSAWDALVGDADDICTQRLRRTRKDILDLLSARSIRVKPPRPDEKWFRQLEFTKRLLEAEHNHAALRVLDDIQLVIEGDEVDPAVHYKLHQHRSAAYLQLSQYEDSIRSGNQALSIDPKGVHALQTTSLAAMLAGRLDLARECSERAISVAPEDTTAWIAYAQVQAVAGGPKKAPPESVSENHSYKAALAQIAANNGDWDQALLLSEAALSTGDRVSSNLLLRAQILVHSGRVSASNVAATEVEALTTEVIEKVGTHANRLTTSALVLRGVCRRIQGNTEEAAGDLGLAGSLSPDNPEIIAQQVQLYRELGDEPSALDALGSPVVSENPLLLAFRAQLHATRDQAAARADLESSLRLLPDAEDPDKPRMILADVAIQLAEHELAEELLDRVTPQGLGESVWLETLWARLWFGRGNPIEGTARIRQATELDPERSAELLTELGSHLQALGQPEDAVAVLSEINPEDRFEATQRILVRALLELHRLAEARQLLDNLPSDEDLPSWALQASIELAIRQEDNERTVVELTQLVARMEDATSTRFELARQLIIAGDLDMAKEQVAILRTIEDLSPTQKTLLAQLMSAIGLPQDALDLAFAAYRENPADPEVNRAFIYLHITSRIPPQPADAIGADTYAKLETKKGEVREFTVYATPPYDPLRNEVSIEDAENLGILGCKRGDIVRFHEGSWREEEWEITEVLSASHHAVQDAMLHFEDRFPSEPFFLAKFSIGDGSSVGDLAPLIASAEDLRARRRMLLNRHKTSVFPLGVLSHSADISIPDIMEALGMEGDSETPLYVEWSNRAGLEASIKAIRNSKSVVITTSSFWSLLGLNALDALQDNYEVIGPNSLEAELKQMLSDAERELHEGRSTMGTDENGRLVLTEIGPNDPILQARLDERQRLLAKSDFIRFEPRPLESIGAPDSQNEQLREMIGASSLDSVNLAVSLNAPLLADDLGLRRIGKEYGVAESFSSVSLVMAWAESGVIGGPLRNTLLLQLLRKGYAFIPPSASLILRAVDSRSSSGEEILSKALNLLSSPLVDIEESARIVSHVVKGLATTVIQTVSVREMVARSLHSMAAKWPIRICVQQVLEKCSSSLILLPETMHEVRQAVAEFGS